MSASNSYTTKELLEWMEEVCVDPVFCEIPCGSPEAPTCSCDSKMGAIKKIIASHERKDSPANHHRADGEARVLLHALREADGAHESG